MIKRRNIFWLILVLNLLCFSNCYFKSVVNHNDLIRYLNQENHGTIKEQLALGTNYKLVYKPIDLIIEQMLHASKTYKYDSLRVLYNDCLYFTLSVSYNGQDVLGGMHPRFNDVLKDMAFGLQQLVSLKEDKSGAEFPLSDFIFPRLYGSSNSSSALLCFKIKELNKLGDFTLYVNDFVNGSPEKMKFKFKKQDLDKVPQLDIKNN